MPPGRGGDIGPGKQRLSARVVWTVQQISVLRLGLGVTAIPLAVLTPAHHQAKTKEYHCLQHTDTKILVLTQITFSQSSLDYLF